MELPLEGGAINASHPRDLCTDALWLALMKGESAMEAGRSIAYVQKLREEAKTVSEKFLALCEPMTGDALRQKLTDLAARCGDQSAETLDRILKPYFHGRNASPRL